MMRALLSQPFIRAVFWSMCLTVLAGALVPRADAPQLFALADKVVHTLAFGALAVVGLRAYPKHLVMVCLLLVILGGLIEIVQGYTSTRSQEWEDFLADTLGIGAGVLMAKFLRFTT